MANRLSALEAEGQAVWLDYLDRSFLAEGEFARLIEQDGVSGVTSNPSIFEKAIDHGSEYDEEIAGLVRQGDLSLTQIYEHLAIADIRCAADALRPTFDRLEGADGYASMEVSPFLANSTLDTIGEARRLWEAVNRPNLMIKVPGTRAGVPAVRELTAGGINVNITLLFGIDMYKAVADAFLTGLEDRVAKGEDISRIASVASFFVSRIDTQIDAAIDARIEAGDRESEALSALRGKVAIANAKLAYQCYLELIASDRWRALTAKGARPQRLLWASTGTKDPAFSDVLYVETLIGRDTINTLPPKTIEAFLDHGATASSLVANIDGARRILSEAERLGLDLAGVTGALVVEGIQKFSDAADTLIGTIAKTRTEMLGDRLNGLDASLPEPLHRLVEDRLERARGERWPWRLWMRDATLWPGCNEDHWLGWLDAGNGAAVDATALGAFAAEARKYKDVVLLGMGGSSLGPEVIGRVLGSRPGHPALHVLDSSDPGQIRTITETIDPANTLFIVSSKSGSTMEPELLRTYFFDLVAKAVGEVEAGKRFVAVTDPGSDLEKVAKVDAFSHVFAGNPEIGGRYSVLSPFGMVPAAAIGVDVPAFFAATRPMVVSCGGDVPPPDNPGLRLGAIIGEAVLARRNKLTILASERLKPFGAWLEQLLAESTGKQNKGVIPVDLEPAGDPGAYGDDRLFVYLKLKGDDDRDVEARLAAIEAAGQPVVRITLSDPGLIGQEFFRWEIATAMAGSIIGIDPFNQPDVEAAKVKARELVAAYEMTGALVRREPVLREGQLSFFATCGATDAAALLRSMFKALHAPGYLGFLAYIERNDRHEAALSAMRTIIRDALQVATVVGFGPRFLHSTGQAYKGGPPGGVFIEITRTADHDLAIPAHRSSFGSVQLAQAIGDLEVLADRRRGWLRIHIEGDVEDGLAAIGRLIARALP